MIEQQQIFTSEKTKLSVARNSILEIKAFICQLSPRKYTQ